MASENDVGETVVTDRHAVTIPSTIRDRLGIEPGDRVRWRVTDGELAVEVVKQRTGVLDDFEPVDMGARDAARDHDSSAVESDDRAD